MKKFSFSLAFVVFSVCQLSASWQAPITNYLQKDYNAGTQNWQIRQQQNGWMYFANNYGLLEYDGYDWTINGIWNSSVIRSLEMGDNGNIYVGGSGEYGYFTPNALGTLTYTPLSGAVPEAYKNFEDVWNIHHIGHELYVQTRNYIFRHNLNTNEVTVIKSDTRIFCSAKIHNNIYVATTKGIYILTDKQLIGLRGSEQLSGREIRGMQAYNGGVLIGTDFDGLFFFNGNAIERFKTDADSF